MIPGFIDAHIHIESSMLTPSRFAAAATVHGTVGAVSDPHEIANVLGKEGIDFMLRDAAEVPFHFVFGAPSCVPATPYETNGATLGPSEIEALLDRDEIGYLSEVMNFPAVIKGERETIAKIEAAKRAGKPVDGHAPGLRGYDLDRYISAGITTDHESTSLEEAEEKIEKGMKILIREGSAAKNFDALAPLIGRFPDRVMFCSDDRHPDDLSKGHINDLVVEAVRMGYDVFDVLRIACINPAEHYNMDTGRLEAGESADFVLVEDLESFRVLETVISGDTVAREGRSLMEISGRTHRPNLFRVSLRAPDDFDYSLQCERIEVIDVLDHELFTIEELVETKKTTAGTLPSIEDDILKITVVNRYESSARPSIAFVRNFGLSRGAIASSVAHDSHNIIAVGCSDEVIARAVNAVISSKGAIVATDGADIEILPLPVAGLMSDMDASTVAKSYEKLNHFVKSKLGSGLDAPFMTLSFMALLVIPELKLSDKGLFDGKEFHYVPLCAK